MPEPMTRLDEEAFVAQILSYLEGAASPQDLSELKEALASRPAARPLFVRVCRLHGALGELLTPRRALGPNVIVEPAPTRIVPGVPPPEDTGEYDEEQEDDTLIP